MRSKTVDTVPGPQNIPATAPKVKRPRAYRGRFTAILASRRLLHRDRDVHAKGDVRQAIALVDAGRGPGERDRKSTRLNSSHGYISYAVFCLKKKKKRTNK